MDSISSLFKCVNGAHSLEHFLRAHAVLPGLVCPEAGWVGRLEGALVAVDQIVGGLPLAGDDVGAVGHQGEGHLAVGALLLLDLQVVPLVHQVQPLVLKELGGGVELQETLVALLLGLVGLLCAGQIPVNLGLGGGVW